MAKGKWESVRHPIDAPLQYDHEVRYTSLFGVEATVSAGGMPVAFNEEDAETVAQILNKQIDEMQDYCINLITDGEEI